MREAIINQLDPLDYAGIEALNTICTNLSFAGNKIQKIVFTSNTASEGKSYMVMQILQNIARRGHRVILIDADLRRSFTVKRHRIETEGEMLGLAHYLVGQCKLEDVVYRTNLYDACIIPAGRDVSNPIALLDSEYFTEMLDRLSQEFDMILVDAPPIGMIIDAAEIARNCDGTVFVVQYNKTHLRELNNCKRQMEQSGCPILGCIVNKVKYDTLSAKRYYSKGYYNQYTSGYYRRNDSKK